MSISRKSLLFAIALGAFALLLVVAYERWWLSRDERKAAIAAIYSIDNLTDATDDPSTFSRYEHETNKLIAAAHIAASTQKDRQIAREIDQYLLELSIYQSFQHSLTPVADIAKDDPKRQEIIKANNDSYLAMERYSKMVAQDRSMLMKELE